MKLPAIQLTPVASIFDDIIPVQTTHNKYPLSFEALNHPNGYVLYTTNITSDPTDPALLSIKRLGDWAQVFVDRVIKSIFNFK